MEFNLHWLKQSTALIQVITNTDAEYDAEVVDAGYVVAVDSEIATVIITKNVAESVAVVRA